MITPRRNPPWKKRRETIGASPDELVAVAIDGLAWHENAPSFEAVAIDEKGAPVRIVATDPRVFAAHKLWLSKQVDRAPNKRRRDASQAEAVGQLVARYLLNLPFDASELPMIPRVMFDQAQPLFNVNQASDDYSF